MTKEPTPEQKTIICDLDGTLCNIEHRLHFLDGKKDWDSFYGACPDDIPNLWCVSLIESMYAQGYSIVFVSGRRESTREQTVAWLQQYLKDGMWAELYMRKDGDYRKDSIIKKEIYDEHLSERNILFVLDDRRQVVDMWREQGLVCLQVAEGNF